MAVMAGSLRAARLKPGIRSLLAGVETLATGERGLCL